MPGGKRQGTGAGTVLALVVLQGRLEEARMMAGVNSHVGTLPSSIGLSTQGWVRLTQPPCPAQHNQPPHQCSNCARPLLPTPRLHLQSKPGSGCHPCDHHVTSRGRDTTTSITASVVWFFFPLMAFSPDKASFLPLKSNLSHSHDYFPDLCSSRDSSCLPLPRQQW